MKTIQLCILLILAIGYNHCLTAADAATEQSESSIETLLLKQLDEERMAFRLYTELGEVHPGMKPFQNIPRAENRHFNALKTYAESQFPEMKIADIDGAFHFAATQELYETWLEKGKASRQAAAEVGVELEKLDIADIGHFLAQEPDAELTAILENLKAASERHLAAFQRHLPGDTAKGPGKARRMSFKPSCCDQ